MTESVLLHELVRTAAARAPAAPALTYSGRTLSYEALDDAVRAFASGLMALGVRRGERIGIYLEKRFETVVASYGAPAAGAVFVPVNPLLKPPQVSFILADCDVVVLVTSADRLSALVPELARCTALRHIILTEPPREPPAQLDGWPKALTVHVWDECLQAPRVAGHRIIDTDLLAILYTSGSTGRPKGVVLSHRNMVAGAKSVASYLGNHADDTLIAALPLSFDAGFSQLNTAFHVGARVVLLNYLLPRDVLRAMEKEGVTGITAVPPLYI
jgi:acyl-CoA synthetase (AMP-forming)/AMP-acid ligase II